MNDSGEPSELLLLVLRIMVKRLEILIGDIYEPRSEGNYRHDCDNRGKVLAKCNQVVSWCHSEYQVEEQQQSHWNAHKHHMPYVAFDALVGTTDCLLWGFRLLAESVWKLYIREVDCPDNYKCGKDYPESYSVGQHVGLCVANLLKYGKRARIKFESYCLVYPFFLDVVKPEYRADKVHEKCCVSR